MSFGVQLIGDLILTIIVLLWARWSKLDIGLRSPIMRKAWALTLLFIAWIVVEGVVVSLSPIATDPAWLHEQQQLPLAEVILLNLVTTPISEELLFRGALFSALTRRWGLKVAVIVPSILWGLLHFQYEPSVVASIAGSGVVLALIRWKSGSIYVPIALHIAANLLDLALAYLP